MILDMISADKILHQYPVCFSSPLRKYLKAISRVSEIPRVSFGSLHILD